jgi:hypothetical protein
MSRKSRIFLTVACVAFLAVCGLNAQQAANTSSALPANGAGAAKPTAGAAMADTKFMKEAAAGGMAEVALGQLAAERHQAVT